MQSSHARRLTVTLPLAGLACLALLAPGAASGAIKSVTGVSTTGKLSSNLTQLASPEVRSASAAEQASALGLPASGGGSLMRRGKDVVVVARVDRVSKGVKDSLRDAGAKLIHSSKRYLMITASVAPSELDEIVALPAVASVTEQLAPMTSAEEAGGTGPSTARAGCMPAATTEGDVQLRAKNARAGHGVTGTGQRVGVLSDSYDTSTTSATEAADDVASGDLPGAGNPCGRTTPVQVLDEIDNPAGSIDEGRAMAQLVHDLAPDARLSIASAFNGLQKFADNVRALEAAGAKVIVDDVSYFNEPFFQEGPVNVAVNDVTADGATYFSSAANSNEIVGGNNVASYEAPAFRGAGSCPAGAPAYATNCMDFNPAAAVDTAYSVTLAPGGGFRLALQWAQPWFGVTTDIDAYIVQAGTLLAASEDVNTGAGGTQQPFEIVEISNPTGTSQTVQIVVNKFSGAANPRLKWIWPRASGITAVNFPTSSGGDIVGPTIFGHNGGVNSMSTAAVPFDNPNTVETFSSRGPVRLTHGPVVGTTPAPPLGSLQTLAKPDIAATDGGQTTFFQPFSPGVFRFFGTSAAAPHAAAVAALQRDGFRTATVNQIKDLQKNTARDVGSFGPTAAGAGLVDALKAVQNLLPGVRIGDVTKTEGDSGTQNYNFPITLTKPSSIATKVRFSTANGTATAPSDYVARTNQELLIPANTTSANIVVQVKGDTAVEPNETFTVKLSKPTRLRIIDGVGVGTINNDAGG